MPELFAETSRIAGIDFSQDLKTGTKRWVIRWFVRTEDELESVGASEYRGIPLTSRQAANWEPDSNEFGFQVDLTYEFDPNQPDEDGETWSFKSSFSEKSIESHPEIQKIIKEYGGVVDADGKITWPKDEVKGSLDGSGNFSGTRTRPGLSAGIAAREAMKKNPLFGETSRLMFFTVATRKYYSKSLSRAFKGVGKIFKNLPGDGPSIDFDEDQDWVKTAPSVDAHPEYGWAITEEYWLSDAGGHTKGLHQAVAGSASS